MKREPLFSDAELRTWCIASFVAAFGVGVLGSEWPSFVMAGVFWFTWRVARIIRGVSA